jgi:hypothetical protein
MPSERIEMTLAVNGEVRATAFPQRTYEGIENQRKQWYFFYGLKSIKDWEIYISHRSSMKENTPFKIEKPFPYLIKSQNNDTEQESRPTSLYCEPVNLAGGLIEIVGRRQSEVLQRVL